MPPPSVLALLPLMVLFVIVSVAKFWMPPPKLVVLPLMVAARHRQRSGVVVDAAANR